MEDIEFCKQLLQLDDDWHVSSIELDEPSNRLDITIRFGVQKKKSFFRRSGDADSQATIVLRHLPLAGHRTYLHVPKPGSVNAGKSWAPAGSTFTHEMEAYIVQALNSSRSMTAAAKLVNITPAEARAISERTGAGIQDEAMPTVTAATPAPAIEVEHVSTKSFDIEDAADIPVETHPNWLRFINGDIPIESNAVALQMLLQRIRQQIADNPTEVTRLSSVRLLRQYFVKNRHLHQAELSAIAGKPVQADTIGTAHDAGPAGIPPEDNACWQKMIDGDLRIDTREVGLQMMLERVRLSVERNPSSDASRRAGIKILRQFFLKHQQRLQSEIDQLYGGIPGSAPMHATPNEQAPAVPAESNNRWRELIEGNLPLATDNVALQMMLERLRLSVEKNPSEPTVAAGIRILRQFFLKHQGRLQTEIRQLGGTAIPAASVNTAAPPPENRGGVPPESHPGWLRLINGELQIKTDIVALKMMLERIRISIGNNPSDASRLAGVKILRQYFLKHQNRHRAEIDQLLAA